MIAAGLGFSRVLRILLTEQEGQCSDSRDEIGFLTTPLYVEGLAVSKMLMKADADLEAKTSHHGYTPLHMAASGGRSEMMSILIEAGANPNSRELGGAIPLYWAAQNEHHKWMRSKVLHRAGANPLFTHLIRGMEGFTIVFVWTWRRPMGRLTRYGSSPGRLGYKVVGIQAVV